MSLTVRLTERRELGNNRVVERTLELDSFNGHGAGQTAPPPVTIHIGVPAPIATIHEPAPAPSCVDRPLDALLEVDGVPAAAFRKIERVGVLDHATGLVWSQDDVSDEPVTQARADELAKAYRAGGFDDWRLPTIRELQSIVDHTRDEPAIDTAFFPNAKSEAYWTSTPAAWSPSDDAWVVGFNNGGAGAYYGRDYKARVRAVRVARAGQ